MGRKKKRIRRTLRAAKAKGATTEQQTRVPIAPTPSTTHEKNSFFKNLTKRSTSDATKQTDKE